MPRLPRPAAAVLATICAVAGVAACSSSGGGGRPSAAGAHAATVTITAAKGCELNATQFAAGGITFTITNKDATSVSEVELLSGERILGEKENVPAGLGGQFAVKVDAGKYTVYCPGAQQERSTITVTGKAAAVNENVAALLKRGTADYKSYVDTQVGYLVSTTAKLNTALEGSDLKAAQKAYIAARPYYEKIEPVAESFVSGKQNLDADIDARAGDVPASKWSGFHLIEKSLFRDKSVTGMAKWGAKLVADVGLLQQKTKHLSYQPPDLANGAQELLDEVAASKITGEEERYSHIDIVDMANNVEGAEQAFADLEPAVQKIDAELARQISNQFAALGKVLDKYRTTSNSSGYVLYTTLNDADRRALAAAVKAVQEPLSRVAGKVASA
ncbi:MAG TPA: iron uptake system protein EfeO [Jatrophihabitantaceae bacterium]|jgi:iron uptake system component EfeO|nr:iron uptake system protein EfeO [Jatrophihabitantaceae bacterium]